MVLLADILAVLHGTLVAYVALGVVAILLGLWRKWTWTRSFWFRFTHLMICIGVVLFEFAHQPCPLTSLEQHLRSEAASEGSYEGGFIVHYVTETMHVEVSPQSLAGPMVILVVILGLLYRHAGPDSVEFKSESKTGSDYGGMKRSRPFWQYVVMLIVVAGGLPALHWFAGGSWAGPKVSLIAVAVGLVICLPWLCASGVRIGETKRWQSHAGWIALLWAIPPLLLAFFYDSLTDSPFAERPWQAWALEPLAQQLIYFGFFYGWMAQGWGEEPRGWGGAFSWPVVGTALAFALSQWPQALRLQAGAMALHVACAFLGALIWLQLRRWTGSLLGTTTNHLIVSRFANVL